MRLLRRYAPRNDTTPDFLRDHHRLVNFYGTMILKQEDFLDRDCPFYPTLSTDPVLTYFLASAGVM
jgi:hypothetical protein